MDAILQYLKMDMVDLPETEEVFDLLVIRLGVDVLHENSKIRSHYALVSEG